MSVSIAELVKTIFSVQVTDRVDKVDMMVHMTNNMVDIIFIFSCLDR